MSLYLSLADRLHKKVQTLTMHRSRGSGEPLDNAQQDIWEGRLKGRGARGAGVCHFYGIFCVFQLKASCSSQIKHYFSRPELSWSSGYNELKHLFFTANISVEPRICFKYVSMWCIRCKLTRASILFLKIVSKFHNFFACFFFTFFCSHHKVFVLKFWI